MAHGPLNNVLLRLRAKAQQAVALSDGDLLERFLAHGDEAAFGALLQRHGPMVLGVCRRVLADLHDAEDAFQATFLVLFRKAGSIRPRHMVGNWLHGVAYRASLKARAIARRHRQRERTMTRLPEPISVEAGLWEDLLAALDQELNALPEKYRVAIILCDLESKTRKEAARQLGWPEGTVAGRLAEGRALLAKRLRKHGLPISAGVLAALFARNSAAAMGHGLETGPSAALTAAAAGTISPKVAMIVTGVSRVMLLEKLKRLMVVLVTAGTLALTGTVSLGQKGRFAGGDLPPIGGLEQPAPHNAPAAAGEAELRRFAGTWDVVAHVMNGEPARQEFLARKLRWIFAANKLTVADKDGVCHEGTIRLDQDRGHGEIDLIMKVGLQPDPGAAEPQDDLLHRSLTGRPCIPLGPGAAQPKEELLHGIYLLQGDTLTICYGFPGVERPVKLLSTFESFTGVVTLRRAKLQGAPQPKLFAELDGTWAIAKMEIEGRSLLKKDEKWKLIIKDGKATSDSAQAPAEAMDLSKILDPTKKPKTITYRYEGQITFYGIYEVSGGELRVCGDGVDLATEKNPEARRPKKFDSKEGLLFVFKREKAPRPDEPEDRVLRIVKELGGTADHDELAPGRPLVAVHLAHRKVTDMHLKALAQALAALEHLHTLDLSDTPLTDEGLTEIARLKQLEWLSLAETRVTDGGLTNLAALKQLRSLQLSSTAVTDAGLEKLTALTSLEYLQLEETKITDQGLKHLAALKRLTGLHVSGTEVTEMGIAWLHKALPRCRFDR